MLKEDALTLPNSNLVGCGSMAIQNHINNNIYVFTVYGDFLYLLANLILKNSVD